MDRKGRREPGVQEAYCLCLSNRRGVLEQTHINALDSKPLLCAQNAFAGHQRREVIQMAQKRSERVHHLGVNRRRIERLALERRRAEIQNLIRDVPPRASLLPVAILRQPNADQVILPFLCDRLPLAVVQLYDMLRELGFLGAVQQSLLPVQRVGHRLIALVQIARRARQH